MSALAPRLVGANRTRGGLLPIGLAVGAVVLGVASVVAPSRALDLALGLLFVGLVFASLAGGVVVFSALVFFAALPGTSGAGLSLIKVAGALLAASWALQLATRPETRRTLLSDRPVLAFAAVGFVGWSLASSLWASSSGAAFSASLRGAQGVLLFFIVYSALRERRQLRLAMLAYVAGATLTALVGMGGGTGADTATAGDRFAGSIGDPNYFAALLVPALAYAAFMFVTERSTFGRWCLGGAAGVIAAALFLTASRGGIVALAAMAVAVVVLAGPVRARALALVSSVSGFGIAYFLLFAPPGALSRITAFSSSASSGRNDLWSIAFRIFSGHPILGIGADNFVLVEPNYVKSSLDLSSLAIVFDSPHVAHNTYIQVATELGLVGLVVFALVLTGTYRLGLAAVRRAARAGDLELEVLARGLLVGLVGLLAAYVFLTAEYEKQIWLVLGFVAAAFAVARSNGDEPAAHAAAVAAVPAPFGRGGASGNRSEPAYDASMREQLVEQREQRVGAQLQSLAEERRRLRHARAALDEEERAVRRRFDELGVRERELDDRARAVAESEAALPPNLEELTDFERARRDLQEQEAALEQRSRELEAAAKRLTREHETAAARQREQWVAEREGKERALAERDLAVKLLVHGLEKQREFLLTSREELDADARQLEQRRKRLEQPEKAAPSAGTSKSRAELDAEARRLDERRRRLAQSEEEIAGRRVAAEELLRAGREQEKKAARLGDAGGATDAAPARPDVPQAEDAVPAQPRSRMAPWRRRDRDA